MYVAGCRIVSSKELGHSVVVYERYNAVPVSVHDFDDLTDAETFFHKLGASNNWIKLNSVNYQEKID